MLNIAFLNNRKKLKKCQYFYIGLIELLLMAQLYFG